MEMIIKPGKPQRSKQRCHDLFWKVHDRAQSFVLRSYTMYEFVSDCVLCTVKTKKRTKTYKKQCFGFQSHTPLLTMHELSLTFLPLFSNKTHQR